MKTAMIRISLASTLLGVSFLASAQDMPSSAQLPTSVPAPANVVDVTGDAGAITERQSTFNVQRQTLKQNADLVEIKARIAEANARIAEAKGRGEPEGQAGPLNEIDPAELRKLLGLPAEGPIVPETQIKPQPARAPMPLDPADTALPKLTSISGQVAIFKVLDNTVTARAGDTINQRYQLASIEKQGATLKRSDGGTRRVMIEWSARPTGDEEDSRERDRLPAGAR